MYRNLVLAAVLALIAPCTAAEGPDLAALEEVLGGRAPDRITETPVPGLYEVVVGLDVLYLSADGEYLIQGSMARLPEVENLTEATLKALRVEAIDDIGEANMVVFAPEDGTRHTVNVFTDVYCGFCRRLHREIDDYMERGIKVRYLMYPVLSQDSFTKAVAVWCAEDRQDALTRAKAGEDVGNATCENPVREHFELGQRMGVRGTPNIVLEDGRMITGYRSAADVAKMLDGG